MATTQQQYSSQEAGCPHGCNVNLGNLLFELSSEDPVLPVVVGCPACHNAAQIDAEGNALRTALAPGIPPLKEAAPAGSVMGEVFSALSEHIESLPTPPEVPRRVVTQILDPLSSIGDVSESIKADAGFSFKVIKMANSAALRGQNEITDLKTAAGRLGMKTLLNIAHALNQQVAYRASDQEYEGAVWRLWNHSIATAHYAAALAEAIGGTDPQLAYIAGLSHDAGKVILLNLLAHHASRTGELLNSPTLLARELDRFGPLATLHVSQHWQLAPPIRQITLYLHDPAAMPSQQYALDARIVALASDIADATGYGFEEAEDGDATDKRDRIRAEAVALGVPEGEIDGFMNRTKRELDEIAGFMAVL